MMENFNYKNRLLASDVEAVGFYPVVNTKEDIHCLCSIDVVTKEVFLFHDNPEFDGVEVLDPYDDSTHVIPPRAGTLEEGVDFWSKCTNNGSKLIVHNAHGYDSPVMDKVFPSNTIPFEAWVDTYNQSKVQWFERPTPKGCKGAHGLKAYGIRCGVNKPEVTDWKTMDAFKLHRVIEDCEIQVETYLLLEKERAQLKDKYGIDFTSAFKIEDLYARDCFKQEQAGALLDQEHAKACVKELDGFLKVLTEEIEPQLPPSVNPRGAKIGRKDIATKLGYDPAKVPDTYVRKKRNGEMETVVEKPYVTPCVNFTKVEKVVHYRGCDVSYGYSPEFPKKKQLTDWIKENHPDTVPKDWGIEKKEKVTKVLNAVTCRYFGVDPTDTDLICGPHTKVDFIPSTMTQNEVVKSFLVKLGWKWADEWNLKKDESDNFIKVEQETTVRWPPKAAPENQMVKVIPVGGLMVSSPKLDEEDYKQLPEGIGKKIAEYNTYKHRRGFLSNIKDPDNKGLLSYVREDGRVPCGVNNFGTRSGRG